MTFNEFVALLPLILVVFTATVVMIAIAVKRSHVSVFVLTIIGQVLALLSIWPAYLKAPQPVTGLLIIDGFSLFFTGLILAAGLLITLLSYGYWEKREGIHEEYYILLLAGLAGAITLTASRHFVSLFLGIEIMSIAIYALSAYQRNSLSGLEAGIKYLILAGTASPFILFGMALMYNQTGSMALSGLLNVQSTDIVFLTGTGLLLVGFGFKLALFPFYLWTPDVYEGAPAIVSAFIGSVSKGAVVAVLVRFFLHIAVVKTPAFVLLFSLLAIASMFSGNLLALRQPNLKRVLAYSSIANMGYILVPLVAYILMPDMAGSNRAVVAIAFYMLAYYVAILGAFGVIAAISGPEHDINRMPDYRELAWRHPWMAALLTACLLSLAGLPLTAGFIGKFLLVTAGVGAGYWALVIILVVNSGLSLYYYFRVIREMYRHPQGIKPVAVRVSWLGGLALAVLMLAIVWLGVYPTSILLVLQRMIAGFFMNL